MEEPKQVKVSSGSEVIDKLLSGGYEADVITTIFGPAGSGKTTMCQLCAIATAGQGKKVIFIDTEGGFSVERFRQLSSGNTELLKKIFLLKPTTFAQQDKMIKSLNNMISDSIGLIIVDTISMLYRIEIGKTNHKSGVNNRLGNQISLLNEITRKNNIPILMTNQVYSDFDYRDRVKMVGGDILKYSSKCLIELENLKNNRKAVLRKHRSIPEGKDCVFRIEEKGFTESEATGPDDEEQERK
jgi:DNA repair protein RadB